MGLFIKCNNCGIVELDFAENGITHIEEVEEHGWTEEIPFQVYICPQCNELFKNLMQLKQQAVVVAKEKYPLKEVRFDLTSKERKKTRDKLDRLAKKLGPLTPAERQARYREKKKIEDVRRDKELDLLLTAKKEAEFNRKPKVEVIKEPNAPIRNEVLGIEALIKGGLVKKVPGTSVYDPDKAKAKKEDKGTLIKFRVYECRYFGTLQKNGERCRFCCTYKPNSKWSGIIRKHEEMMHHQYLPLKRGISRKPKWRSKYIKKGKK